MRASELRKILHFHIEKLLFLSIYCWYFRNFVGTNDILVGLHVPTDFQMYRQNSEKASWGGGNCPPPPLATLGRVCNRKTFLLHLYITVSTLLCEHTDILTSQKRLLLPENRVLFLSEYWRLEYLGGRGGGLLQHSPPPPPHTHML